MTRIIAGGAGGRRLGTPQGDGTRPTSDRVREALFSSLEAWAGNLTGLRVLDLYAGSGALGLEAWSRGAAAVWFVEKDRAAAAVVSANVRDLGCPVARVVTGPVGAVLSQPAGEPFDVVLSDPPYPLSEEELAADLVALVEHGWLAPDALVVVERGRRSPEPAWPAGLEAGRRKKYGETVLWYGHAAPAASVADDPQEDES